jgi:hypothetical protein
MSRYQKVLVCIFRTIGILFISYGAMALVAASLMANGMMGMSLFAILPFMILGLLLYFTAIPFAKIITIGIEE